MNLSEHESKVLKLIETQLRTTDPRLAKLLTFGRVGVLGRLRTLPPAAVMLICGMLLMCLGGVTVLVPLGVAGMMLSLFSLLLAHIDNRAPRPRYGW